MTKIICKIDDGSLMLSDKEILNIKPVIDRFGKAKLLVNYYDFEYCVKSTLVL